VRCRILFERREIWPGIGASSCGSWRSRSSNRFGERKRVPLFGFFGHPPRGTHGRSPLHACRFVSQYGPGAGWLGSWAAGRLRSWAAGGLRSWAAGWLRSWAAGRLGSWAAGWLGSWAAEWLGGSAVRRRPPPAASGGSCRPSGGTIDADARQFFLRQDSGGHVSGGVRGGRVSAFGGTASLIPAVEAVGLHVAAVGPVWTLGDARLVFRPVEVLPIAPGLGGRVLGVGPRTAGNRSRGRRVLGAPLEHRRGAATGASRATHPLRRRLATVQRQPVLGRPSASGRRRRPPRPGTADGGTDSPEPAPDDVHEPEHQRPQHG
jgi:hypothetical protein